MNTEARSEERSSLPVRSTKTVAALGRHRYKAMALASIVALTGLSAYLLSNAHTVTTDDAFVIARTVSVAPEVSAKITAVRVREHQRVQQGDVLVELDPELYEIAVARARSELHSAEAQAQLAEARSNAATAEADLALATSRVETAHALVKSADAALSRTRILAPMTGVVEHVTAERGMLVGPPATLLAIVSTDDVWVEARIKETSVSRLHEGQGATISVDALGHDLTGHIEGIGSATLSRFSLLPNEATGAHFVRVAQRIPILIRLDQKSEQLKAGLSATVTIKATR